MSVCFYLPPDKFPAKTPLSRDELWPRYLGGEYAWVLQTYLALREIGKDYKLVSEIPKQGIVIAHSASLPKDLLPGKNRLLVCVQADWSRHPWAQIHIVQNPKALKQNDMGMDIFMRHWPQPSLIARDKERGLEFKRIGFFGTKENILPGFLENSWAQKLNSAGLEWVPRLNPNDWNNYRDIDCVVAIRTPGIMETSWKPATKLYNAWRAGVPAILDRGEAYRFERKTETDYLEASDPDEVYEKLLLLKSDQNLRIRMAENGSERAKETDTAVLAKAWEKIISEGLKNYHGRWSKSFLFRLKLYATRSFAWAKTKV